MAIINAHQACFYYRRSKNAIKVLVSNAMCKTVRCGRQEACQRLDVFTNYRLKRHNSPKARSTRHSQRETMVKFNIFFTVNSTFYGFQENTLWYAFRL